MNGRVGIPLLVVAALLVVLGVAWGAATQHETFLGQTENEQQEAAGSLVFLSAAVVGIGVAMAVAVLGRAGWLRRTAGTAEVLLAVWVLVFLVQADYPNYDAYEEKLTASLAETTLLREGAGGATVLLPVIVAGLGAFLVALDGVRRAMGRPTELSSRHAWHRLLGANAVMVPIMIVAAMGAMRVLVSIPDDNPGAGLGYILLPLAAAACLAAVVIVMIRTWHFAMFLDEPRLAPFTRESWRALERIELAVAVIIGATALMSIGLPGVTTDETSIGRTLVFTLWSHGLGLGLVLIPLLIAARQARICAPFIDETAEADDRAKADAVGLTVAGAAGLVMATMAMFTGQGLVPWILAFLPLAVFGAIRVSARPALPLMFVAAWVCWAKGNTVLATYDGNAYPTLDFVTGPAVLSLWRLLGAALAAWGATRLFMTLNPNLRSAAAIPLAMGGALGMVLLGIVEVPLHAWDESRVPVNKIAVGSMLRSQAPEVQLVAHIVAAISGIGATLSIGRLIRPEWFARRVKMAPVDSPASATGS